MKSLEWNEHRNATPDDTCTLQTSNKDGAMMECNLIGYGGLLTPEGSMSPAGRCLPEGIMPNDGMLTPEGRLTPNSSQSASERLSTQSTNASTSDEPSLRLNHEAGHNDLLGTILSQQGYDIYKLNITQQISKLAEKLILNVSYVIRELTEFLEVSVQNRLRRFTQFQMATCLGGKMDTCHLKELQSVFNQMSFVMWLMFRTVDIACKSSRVALELPFKPSSFKQCRFDLLAIWTQIVQASFIVEYQPPLVLQATHK